MGSEERDATEWVDIVTKGSPRSRIMLLSHGQPDAGRPQTAPGVPLGHAHSWVAPASVSAPLGLNPPSVPTALNVKPKIFT